MTGAFDRIRHPDRYTALSRQYPRGAHWHHNVANLLGMAVLAINDGIIDLAPVRLNPRVSLPRYKPGTKRCVVTVSLPVPGQRSKRRHKRIPIALGENAVVIGDEDLIYLGVPDGPMVLVNALVDLIETFWLANAASE